MLNKTGLTFVSSVLIGSVLDLLRGVVISQLPQASPRLYTPPVYSDPPVLIKYTLWFVSSEGALRAITPYDYLQQQHPLFEHTPVLDNNLNINAMMTLLTMITIKTEITETKSAASAA